MTDDAAVKAQSEGVREAVAREAAFRIARFFLGNDDALPGELRSGACERHFLLDEILALLTQPRAGEAADMVLVPREPTQVMIDAAAATPGMKAANDTMTLHQARGYGFKAGAFDDGSPLHQAWRAMVDAALTITPEREQWEDVERRAKELCDLLYAHHVIKYDPAAALRCAIAALSRPSPDAVEAALPEQPSEAVIRAVDKAAHEHWPNARKMALGMYAVIRDAASNGDE